jgi:HAD superfamily hydrolase (TIGR01509 family)
MDQPYPPRALLLDLDGTIADTLPHIFDAYRHAVAPWVERPPTDTEVEATFGPAERECIARMVPGVSLDEAERRFHEFYEAELGNNDEVVEGIVEAIEHARSLGWRIGVFTGKGRRSTRFTLEGLGLLDRIELLVTSDDVTRPKPDPEGVFLASKALAVPAGNILLAGDSPADVRAGREAGAKTVAVLWAAYNPGRLREAGADFVCERVCDLVAAIETVHASGWPKHEGDARGSLNRPG